MRGWLAIAATSLLLWQLPAGGQPERGVAAEQAEQTFRQVMAVAVPRDVEQIAAAQSGLIATRAAGRIQLIEAASGAVRAEVDPAGQFLDMSATGDGRFLYALDGAGPAGAAVAAGDEPGPWLIHRLDVEAGTWTQARIEDGEGAGALPSGVVAISADRLVLLTDDSIDLLAWGDPARVVASERWRGAGRAVYDARSLRLWLVSHDTLGEFVCAGEFVAPVHWFTRRDLDGEERPVLSTGAEALYCGTIRFDLRLPIPEEPFPAEGAGETVNFPEPILAATAQVAFSAERVYNAATGAPVGELGFEASAFAAAPDSAVLWSLDAAGGVVRGVGLQEGETEPGALDAQPYDLFDQFLTALARGDIGGFLRRSYDADTAAIELFGHDYRLRTRVERLLVRVRLRHDLHARLPAPDALRGGGRLANIVAERRQDGNWEVGFRVEGAQAPAQAISIVVAGGGDERGGRLVDVLFDQRSFVAAQRMDLVASGGGLMSWAFGKPGAGDSEPEVDSLMQAGIGVSMGDWPAQVPSDPRDTAEWFCAALQLRRFEILKSAFDLHAGNALIFGDDWDEVAADREVYIEIVMRLAMEIERWLGQTPAGEHRVLDVSSSDEAGQRTVHYTVQIADGATRRERLLLRHNGARWWLVDWTRDSAWVLQPRGPAYREAGVEPLRFAERFFEPPGPAPRAPLPEGWTPDTSTPLATTRSFRRLLRAFKPEEAFDECFDPHPGLRLILGAEGFAAQSHDELAAREETIRSIVMPLAENPYQRREIYAMQYRDLREASSDGKRAQVAGRYTDLDGFGADEDVRFLLRFEEGRGWRIVDFRFGREASRIEWFARWARDWPTPERLLDSWGR